MTAETAAHLAVRSGHRVLGPPGAGATGCWGHRVLAITDNALSPVADLATHVLFVNEARLGHFRSQVPAMVVCQAIIVSLGRRLGP